MTESRLDDPTLSSYLGNCSSTVEFSLSLMWFLLFSLCQMHTFSCYFQLWLFFQSIQAYSHIECICQKYMDKNIPPHAHGHIHFHLLMRCTLMEHLCCRWAQIHFIANLYISLSLSLRSLSLVTTPTPSSVVSYSAHALILLLRPHVLQTPAKFGCRCRDARRVHMWSVTPPNTLQIAFSDWLNCSRPALVPLGDLTDSLKASTQWLRAIYITICILHRQHLMSSLLREMRDLTSQRRTKCLTQHRRAKQSRRPSEHQRLVLLYLSLLAADF